MQQVMSESRQQRRARERAEQLLTQKIATFRKSNPLAEKRTIKAIRKAGMRLATLP